MDSKKARNSIRIEISTTRKEKFVQCKSAEHSYKSLHNYRATSSNLEQSLRNR